MPMRLRNSWNRASSIFLITILVSACGQSGSSQEQSTDSNKTWSEDAVFQQAIDLSTVKEWGYFDNSYSDKTEVVDFENNGNIETPELVSVKPVDCLPLAVLLEDSPDSGAKYLLKQNHSDSDTFPSQSMIFRIFVYDSEEKSKKAFEAVKPIATKCGNYIANRSDEVFSRDLWQEATLVNDDLIEAVNLEYDEANALGRLGSAIYYIYFLNFEKMEKSKDHLQKAITIVNKNLSK
jgi:hypothetical protein